METLMAVIVFLPYIVFALLSLLCLGFTFAILGVLIYTNIKDYRKAAQLAIDCKLEAARVHAINVEADRQWAEQHHAHWSGGERRDQWKG